MTIEPGSAENYLVAASGCIPAFLAMFYFDWLDRKRPEPWKLRYLVTLVGVLSVIPAVAFGMFAMSATKLPEQPTSYATAAAHAFGIAAGFEEASKISVVFMVVWYSRSFDERMDGLVYGARAGLGFALIENCLYIYKFAPTDALVGAWVGRALLAVPGHAMWTGMLGYCAARQKFDKAGPGIFGGYLIAVFFHGTYDFSLFARPFLERDFGKGANLVLLVPLLLTVIGWITVRKLARRALMLDDQSEARQAQMAAQMPPQMAYQPQQYYYYWPGPPRR